MKTPDKGWGSGFDIFKIYCAVKSHFNGSFNIAKYGLRTSVTFKSFEKRSDKVFFERLASKLPKDECYQMFVSNFAANPNALSYELAGSNAYDFYLKHSGFLDVFSSNFTSEISGIFELLNKNGKTLKDLFNCNGQPVILQLVLRNNISIETFIVLNRLLKFVPVLDKHLDDDLIWHNFRSKVMAYDSILNVETEILKMLFKKTKNQIQ